MSLNYLLVFIPICLGLRVLDAGDIAVFATALLSLVPLANLLGTATEHLAHYLGETLGGLLNASLGNVPEIIVALLALSKGLNDVVKASITGSILGNLLITLGLPVILGGIGRQRQTFNSSSARLSTSILFLAVTAMVVPAAFHHSTRTMTDTETTDLSIAVAVVLLVVYALSLVFTLVTHQNLFRAKAQAETPEVPDQTGEAKKEAVWSKTKALSVLAGSTVVLAVISEALTDALEPAAAQLGMTETFAGIILLATAGNLGGIINGVGFARTDKMDLTFAISVSGATQVALLVTPILVFSSLLMGNPMDLLFTPFEIIALFLAVLIVGRVAPDGECNWFEGVMLVGVYMILAIAFFFLPA